VDKKTTTFLLYFACLSGENRGLSISLRGTSSEAWCLIQIALMSDFPDSLLAFPAGLEARRTEEKSMLGLATILIKTEEILRGPMPWQPYR